MKSTLPTRSASAIAMLVGVILALGATTAQAGELGALNPVFSAASTTDYEPTPAQKLRAAYWRGRTCTTALCKSPRPGGIAEVASFGLAAFGGAWISRRRSG